MSATYRGWTLQRERMGHTNVISPGGEWAGGYRTDADARRRVDDLIERAETVAVRVIARSGRVAYLLAKRAPVDTGREHGPEAA